MSKTDQKTTPAITSRFLACVQSTGRIGKSFCAEGIMSALKFEGVPFCAVDVDRQHQTLSKRHHNKVQLVDATRSIDEFSLMIQDLPKTPVIIVDFPAQITGFFLDSSKRLQLLEFFEGQGIRATFLIFTADDSTAKESAADIVRIFQDRVDYLLVENPARFKSAGFKNTGLGKWFEERKTPTLKIPYVTAPTIEAWERLERKIGSYLSLDEVRVHPEIHGLSRLELDFARNQFLVQCEDYASRILPDANLVKTKVVRAEELQLATVSPLADELLR